MTMHLSPTSSDPEVYLGRFGERPIVHLDRLGVLGDHLLVGHGVWLDDDEVELALVVADRDRVLPVGLSPSRAGCVPRRPARRDRRARRSGRARLRRVERGRHRRHPAHRGRGRRHGARHEDRTNSASVPTTAFELATIRGAEAIGMADRIGSLEPGKLADLVVHDTTAINFTPPGDLAPHLVWGTDGRTVRDVVVDGEIVLRDRRCTHVDDDQLRAEAGAAQPSTARSRRPRRRSTWPVVEAR